MSELLKHLAVAYSTFFYSGYLRIKGNPYGGFAATVLGGGVVWLSNHFSVIETSSIWYFLILVVAIVVAIFAVGLVVTKTDPDPKKVSIDEFVGVATTLSFLPADWWWMLSGIVLFRALDVLKPFGIRRLEKLPKGYGVVLDDVGAGLVGALILNVLRLVVERF